MKSVLPAAALMALAVTGCRDEQSDTKASTNNGTPPPELKGGDLPDSINPVKRRAMKARLTEALPEGANVSIDPSNDDELGYTAMWSRPGFPANLAIFGVTKKGTKVTIDVTDHGKWVYESGKLVNETSLGEDAQKWDWLKKRAGEIATATSAVN